MQLQQLASDVDSDEEDALRRQVDPRWSRDAGAAEREDELDAEPESGEAMSPEELHAQRLGACPGQSRADCRIRPCPLLSVCRLLGSAWLSLPLARMARHWSTHDQESLQPAIR